MDIGIIGFGVVGHAITKVFEQKGFTVHVNDIKPLVSRTNHHKSYLREHCDVIFICVSTPLHNGSMDLRQVEKSLIFLEYPSPNNPLIVIKSTVTPGFTMRMQQEHPTLRIVFNPEFLRAESPIEDFQHPDRIIIGTTNPDDADLLLNVYASWGTMPKIVCDPTTAEVVKLVSNAFLVHKVAFACEIANICEVYDVIPDRVMDYVSMDHRIDSSHLMPSQGKIAKQSPCLPKDLMGLIHDLEKHGYDSLLLCASYKQGISN